MSRWLTLARCHRCLLQRRGYSSATSSGSLPPTTTRNIGIIAHIDAGKTTTTERMLYYSGFTRRLGDVDDGSTVTDFLPAERARGITIQSAAVTFSWPPASSAQESSTQAREQRLSTQPHNINLIDTPGHADFTFEVLRSLRILDGAVCILDGVAGVEAQTEQVWKQASVYQIPRLIYVNKLDRDGAAFARTVREVGSRLGVWPVVCQIPWWQGSDSKLQGVGDVLGLRALRYVAGGDGKNVEVHQLADLEKRDPTFAAELRTARTALIELLSEHDDDMVETFLECEEDHLAISELAIINSLRKLTLQSPQMIAPVFAGASFRNIGVQPLLDSVVDLLPAPEQRPDPSISLGSQHIGLSQLLSGQATLHAEVSGSRKPTQQSKNAISVRNIETCALAFKVVSDARRGILVYVRVYSGQITRNAQLWNTNLSVSEKAQRLLRMHANDAVEVDSIQAGQIGVIPGLKHARTGDTLISYGGGSSKTGPPAPLNTLQLRPIDVPPPVFFTSVEPDSLSEEKHVFDQLALLLREDPSLQVTQDPDSGQTHLAGMGELHLEIARDRLVNDLKAKARIGAIQIGYREAITMASDSRAATFERDTPGRDTKASCTASVAPADGDNLQEGQYRMDLIDGNSVTITVTGLSTKGRPLTEDDTTLPDTLPMSLVHGALQSGVAAALARGPSHSYAVHSTSVHITLSPITDIYPNTTAAALSAAARLATTKALKDSALTSSTILMEPVMRATISVDEPSLGAVVHDLSAARGGQIISLDGEEDGSSSDGGADGAEDMPVIDVKRIYAPPDPFGASGMEGQDGAGTGQMRQIVAKVPLKEMVGYLKHLRSLTAGRGTFTMKVDSFERMSTQRMKVALGEMRGDYG